jgi:hypothetical protein
MTLTPIKGSSQIAAVGYDSKTQTLQIKFQKGGLYSYHPFTQEAYVLLLNAESPGKFFHANIRNNELITATKVPEKTDDL